MCRTSTGSCRPAMHRTSTAPVDQPCTGQLIRSRKKQELIKILVTCVKRGEDKVGKCVGSMVRGFNQEQEEAGADQDIGNLCEKREDEVGKCVGLGVRAVN